MKITFHTSFIDLLFGHYGRADHLNFSSDYMKIPTSRRLSEQRSVCYQCIEADGETTIANIGKGFFGIFHQKMVNSTKKYGKYHANSKQCDTICYCPFPRRFRLKLLYRFDQRMMIESRLTNFGNNFSLLNHSFDREQICFTISIANLTFCIFFTSSVNFYLLICFFWLVNLFEAHFRFYFKFFFFI